MTKKNCDEIPRFFDHKNCIFFKKKMHEGIFQNISKNFIIALHHWKKCRPKATKIGVISLVLQLLMPQDKFQAFVRTDQKVLKNQFAMNVFKVCNKFQLISHNFFLAAFRKSPGRHNLVWSKDTAPSMIDCFS